MEKKPFFISGDVYQNLGFENPSISREKMEESCKRTGIHRDIMELGKQYRTEVTEGASKFSSGQKQKQHFLEIYTSRGFVINIFQPDYWKGI